MPPGETPETLPKSDEIVEEPGAEDRGIPEENPATEAAEEKDVEGVKKDTE